MITINTIVGLSIMGIILLGLYVLNKALKDIAEEGKDKNKES